MTQDGGVEHSCPVGHIDVNSVSFVLPDGRPLLDEVSLRVGEGAKVALIGPNGTGRPLSGGSSPVTSPPRTVR